MLLDAQRLRQLQPHLLDETVGRWDAVLGCRAPACTLSEIQIPPRHIYFLLCAGFEAVQDEGWFSSAISRRGRRSRKSLGSVVMMLLKQSVKSQSFAISQEQAALWAPKSEQTPVPRAVVPGISPQCAGLPTSWACHDCFPARSVPAAGFP